MMLKINRLKVIVFKYCQSNPIIKRHLHNFTHQKLLGKYLFFTNTISSGLLMAVGDGVQQHMEFYKNIHKGENYDWKRMVNMTAVGLVLGTVQHFFYKHIDILLPKRTIRSVAKKIILDQTIASPCAIFIFFYGLGLLEDGNLKGAHNEMKQKFLTIYMMDWVVWPPTQFLNFAYLSSKYRVIYINFVTMIYDVFLSYIKFENKDFHYSQFLTLPDWKFHYNRSSPSPTPEDDQSGPPPYYLRT